MFNRYSYRFNYGGDDYANGTYIYEKIKINIKELAPELNDYLNSQTPATYIIYGIDYDGAQTVDLICKNDQTLSLIRPATFMDDFLPKTQNPAYLDLMIRRYAKQAIDRLIELGF